jgi:hypothetical protein
MESGCCLATMSGSTLIISALSERGKALFNSVQLTFGLAEVHLYPGSNVRIVDCRSISSLAWVSIA